MTKNMQQREFFFDELTARDVAERLRVRAEIDAYLNAVALTTARLNGARPDERVILNRDGSGVIVTLQNGMVTDITPGVADGSGDAPEMAGKRQK